jgi:competence protein ComFC
VKEVLPQLKTIKRAALDFLFPQRCLGCGNEGELICQQCRNGLSRIFPPLCPRCGKPQASGILCPACINWQGSIDAIRSPFKFEGVIREAIHQFKYQNLRSLTGLFGLLLKDFWMPDPLPVDLVVPVPLHSRRLKERGYNQSALLASEFGKIFHLPVFPSGLTRTRYIIPQAQTRSVAERRSNMKQAFVCRDSTLAAKQVLLIDDVSTSGATLDACAEALKTAGAKSVWGLVLAREL